MGQIRLRYYNFISLLDTAFSLYRRNFALFFWITAAFLLLPNLLVQIVSVYYIGPTDLFDRLGTIASMLGSIQTGEFQSDELENIKRIAMYALPVNAIVMILKALWYGPLINAIHRNAVGRGCGFREAFRIGWRKYLNLFFGLILVDVLYIVILSPLILGIFAALGIGGQLSCMFVSCCALLPFVVGTTLLTAVLLSVFFQAIVIEDKGPLEALGRSIRLIWGYWWWAFGIMSTVILINNVIYGVSEVSFTGLNTFILRMNPELEIFGGALVATGLAIVQIFILPIIIIGQTILFYDLKTRKEAFDIQVMIKGF